MALAFVRRLWRRLKYRHFDRDLREELSVHQAMAEDVLREEGVGADDARREAAMRLGNSTLERERSRAVWVPLAVEQLQQDVRYAWRGLRRQPGFTVASVVMLTVGIGLVAGFYVVFNGLFVRGWSLPDYERIFVADASRAQEPSTGRISDGFSMAGYRHIVASSRAADYVVLGFDNVRVRTTAGSGGEYTYGLFVSDNFVTTMGVPVRLGRDPGAEITEMPAVLISDRLWRRVFGADPSLIGRPVWLSGSAAIISGVMAPEFQSLGPRPVDLIARFRDAPALNRRSTAAVMKDESICCVSMAGRLRDGWTLAQAEQELEILTSQHRQAARLPALTVAVTDTSAGRALVNGSKGQTVVLTLSLAGLSCAMMWVLACANVGNLYLARSLRRRGEIAMRLALGASRGRVVRQLFVEGAALGFMAGAGALLLTFGVPFVFNLIDDGTPTSMFPTDWRVAMVAGISALGASLLVALAPALQTTRGGWRGAAVTAAPSASRLRGALLAAQIAVAVTLVVGAALLTRAITAAINLDTDYALRTTTGISFDPPSIPAGVEVGSAAHEQLFRTHRQSVEAAVAALRSASGLSLGLANTSLARGLDSISTAVNELGSEIEFRVDLMPFNAAAFNVLEIPIVRGRFAADDPVAAEAVVNERLASAIAPAGDVIGKTIVLHFNKRRYTIVGVARDTHLTDFDRVDPIVHTASSVGFGSPMFFARTTPGIDKQVVSIVKSAAPDVQLTVAPLSNALRATIDMAATAAAIAGGLGLLALLLSMLGVFTVFAYIVEERRRDVGIRLALGASRRQIRWMMFRAARGAVVGGLAAGLVLAMSGGALLRSFLFGVSPLDPLSYLTVVALMMAAALVATAIPVRRAFRIDPAVVLKGD